MQLSLLLSKLFREEELKEVAEVELAIFYAKAALLYKQLDFDVLFLKLREDENIIQGY